MTDRHPETTTLSAETPVEDDAPTTVLPLPAGGARLARPALRTPQPGAEGERPAAVGRVRRVLAGTRVRLLASYVVLLSLATLVSVLALREVLLNRLDDQVESDLTQEVEELQQLVTGRDPDTGQPFGDDIAAVFDTYLRRNIPTPREEVFTYVDGQPYASTDSPRLDLFEVPSLTDRWAALSRVDRSSATSEQGPIEFLAVPVLGSDGTSRGTFVITAFTRGARAEVDEAVRVAALVDLLVLALASAAAWGAAGRALAPLRRMTHTAQRIQATDLSQRIQVAGGDEVAVLGRTFNAMLDRLQAALDGQRQLTSDVGHELRTPITIVRGHLELMGDDPEDRRETVALVLDELGRMARLVDDLLLLARSERADFLQRHDVDTGALLRDAATKAAALGDRRWVLDGVADVALHADGQRLTQALLQLAANAVRHTGPDGTVALGSSSDGSELRLWVRDTGDGIPAEDHERVFERFARGQVTRGEGNGLGLSLVRAIATAHGGRVELTSAPGLGSRFTLVVPVVAPTAGRADEPSRRATP